MFPDSVVYEVCGPDMNPVADPLYRRSYAIDEAGVVTMGDPTPVRQVLDFVPVTGAVFSMTATGNRDGSIVEKAGKIFELGDYPDRDFSLNEDEADAAIAAFVSVPIDLEHIDTILAHGDRKNRPANFALGELVKVWREGNSMFGTVNVPAWLDDVVGADGFPVSATWDRSTKRLAGLAITLNPKISDAAVFAAFAKSGDDEARTGESAMKPNLYKRVQNFFASFSSEELAELTKDEAPQDPPADPQTDAPVVDAPDKDALIADLQAKLEAANAKSTSDDEGKIQAEAEKFAADAILRNRAVPSEREALIASFKFVAATDASGKAVFSDAGEFTPGAGVELLKAQIDARPELKFTQEQLKEGFVGVVFSGEGVNDADGQPSPERIRELMAMTPLGKQILQEKKN